MLFQKIIAFSFILFSLQAQGSGVASSPFQAQSAQERLDSLNIAENDTISLTRTICFGSCPEYSLTLYGSGRLIYEGRANVERLGHFEYQLSPWVVRLLFTAVDEFDYFQLQEVYDDQRDSHDLPWVVTAVQFSHRSHKVSNYGNLAPLRLLLFEELVDKVLLTAIAQRNSL